MGKLTMERNVEGAIDILDIFPEAEDLNDIAYVLSCLGKNKYYCEISKSNPYDIKIKSCEIKLIYSDKDDAYKAELIFDDNTKKYINFFDILCNCYSDIDTAKTFIKEYNRYD